MRFAMVPTAFVLASLLASSLLSAQPRKSPSLNEILERLEANLNQYDAGVPSLFCDEHTISSRKQGDLPDQVAVTDSVFRLKRFAQPDRTTVLVESRELKSVPGKPAASPDIDGPTLLSGLFEGGLAVVSLNQTACMNYTLHRINSNRPGEPYIVHFATVLTPGNSAGCMLQEESRGWEAIDPISMHVKHLEIVTRRHTIIDGSPYREPIVGKREITMDYAPVLLDGVTFWMPSGITMRNTGGFGFHQVVWLFRATYRNYHRLEVTSHVLDGTASHAPEK